MRGLFKTMSTGAILGMLLLASSLAQADPIKQCGIVGDYVKKVADTGSQGVYCQANLKYMGSFISPTIAEQNWPVRPSNVSFCEDLMIADALDRPVELTLVPSSNPDALDIVAITFLDKCDAAPPSKFINLQKIVPK